MNRHRPLTAFSVSGGMQTAYTAPSGTAVSINYLSLATNYLSGTAGGFSALILAGPTAAPITLVPITGITANTRLLLTTPFALESASWGVWVSANSASAFDLYMAGLLMT